MGSEITKTESVMYGSIKWEKKDVTLIEFYNVVFENDGDYCYIFSGDKVNEISINKFDYINNCVYILMLPLYSFHMSNNLLVFFLFYPFIIILFLKHLYLILLVYQLL